MLIYSILFLLLSNAVTLRRDKSILYSRVAMVILIYSLIILINSLYLSYLSKGIGLFGGLFHSSGITHSFQLLIFLVSIIILHLTGFYPRRVLVTKHSSILDLLFSNFNYFKGKIINKKGEPYKILEYPLIILFIITGGVFLISASDLISIFISIELQSYGLYLLCTLYRNSELATGGGLTYFLLGGLSSCFILLGISLLYINSGTTNLDGVYVITGLTDALSESNSSFPYLYKSDYINISLLILSVGFLFKVSAAPFHFWSPDVYDAIPTVVTTFVAIIAKISIFIFLLELVHYSNTLLINSNFNWTTGLLMSSLLSLIIGTVVGLTQFRIKRLFAYSTISHVGFILLALSINSMESIQAFMFYLIQYSLSNLNAFIILISIGLSFYYYINNNKEFENLEDKNNSPIQLISQMKGFFYINPVLALSLAITIFSFAGIPPLIGFFAKQMVLSAALDSGYVFITLVAILTSVIGAVYYLNIVKQIFFDEVEYIIDPAIKNVNFLASIELNSRNDYVTFKYNNIILSSSLTISISILTLITLLFFLMTQQWLGMTNVLSLILFDS